MLEGGSDKLHQMALTRGQAHDLVRMQFPLEFLLLLRNEARCDITRTVDSERLLDGFRDVTRRMLGVTRGVSQANVPA